MEGLELHIRRIRLHTICLVAILLLFGLTTAAQAQNESSRADSGREITTKVSFDADARGYRAYFFDIDMNEIRVSNSRNESVHSGPTEGEQYSLDRNKIYFIRIRKPEGFFAVSTGKTRYPDERSSNIASSVSLSIGRFNVRNEILWLRILIPILLIASSAGGFLLWRFIRKKNLELEAARRALAEINANEPAAPQSEQPAGQAGRSLREQAGREQIELPSSAPKTILEIGDYKVIDRLGRGGMATVYKVKDKYGDIYALKVPHPHIFEDAEFKKRFLREAKHIQSLNHPNIVRMFDYSIGRDDSTPFICLEFVDGVTLKSFMEKNPMLPMGVTLRIASQIASALGFAHSKGIIHRDIKPENIMVTKKNEIKIMDLGISRGADSTTLTSSSATIGTPYYLAPEQVQSSMVDARADLYSLGVIMYEMLTARLPFASENPVEIIMKKMAEAPPPPRRFNALIPGDIEKIVLKLMETDPAKRFQSARELLEAIETLNP